MPDFDLSVDIYVLAALMALALLAGFLLLCIGVFYFLTKYFA